MAIRVDRDITAFGGAHAVRLSNGDVELIASTDYGPRILSYARAGGRNVFGLTEESVPTPFREPWRPYGGHRLWHAPEDPVRTYVPDNGPIHAEIEEGALVLSQPVEAPTHLQKQLRVALDDRGSRVRVVHRIRNLGERAIDLAVWALTIMAPGGTVFLPNPPFVPHPEALLPARRLVLWPYTFLDDARFRLGRRFLRVCQDSESRTPQKVGLSDAQHGWAAYAWSELLFLKRYPVCTAETPLVDLGCNVEVFTNAKILELETLGPLVTLAPGASAEHVETWELFGDVVIPDDDELAAAKLAEIAEADPRSAHS